MLRRHRRKRVMNGMTLNATTTSRLNYSHLLYVSSGFCALRQTLERVISPQSLLQTCLLVAESMRRRWWFWLKKKCPSNTSIGIEKRPNKSDWQVALRKTNISPALFVISLSALGMKIKIESSAGDRLLQIFFRVGRLYYVVETHVIIE